MSVHNHCPECGQENESQGKFCSGCGKAFDELQGATSKPKKVSPVVVVGGSLLALIFGFAILSELGFVGDKPRNAEATAKVDQRLANVYFSRN